LLHQRKLEQYQRLTEAQMREIIPDDAEESTRQLPFWAATLRFGIEYEMLYLSWLDETLRTLGALD
jgi:hypothetical protein